MSCQQTPPQRNHSDAETAQAWLRFLINEWNSSQAASLHISALFARLLSALTQEDRVKTSTGTRTGALPDHGYGGKTKKHGIP